MLGVELDELVEELQAVAQVPGAVRARGLSRARGLLQLPRYTHADDPIALLEADIRQAISRDLREEYAQYLSLYLCLSQDAPTELMARYEAISETLFRNPRLVRGELQLKALGELAFQLHAWGVGVHHRQAHVLGLGIRNIAHDWTVTQFEVPPRRELYRFETAFEAVSPNQRVFIAGQSLYGSTIVDSPRPLTAQHSYVGTVPVDPGDPSGAVLHVFFAQEPLRLGRRDTIVYEVDTRAPEGSTGSSIEFNVVSPVEKVTLRAIVPPEMTSVYTVADHDPSGPVGGEGQPIEVVRDPGAPLVYTIERPEINHLYELAWPDGSGP